MADELVRTIELSCGAEHAFTVFTEMIDLWWPRGHRRHGDGALSLEARPGGALLDRAPDGTAWRMGEVVAFEPPVRLDLDWYPGSPAAPTSVEIRFAETAGGCAVTVTHRTLPGSRSTWPERIAAFIRGWDAVLPALKSFIEEH